MTAARILFVSHDASRSGAPFLLLHLLRWLRANTNLEFSIALNESGPLEAQFAELAPVTVFQREAVSAPRRALDHMMPYRAKTAAAAASLRRALGMEPFALVYSNTLVNANLLRALSDQTCPLISHVHELEYVLRQWATAADLQYVFARTDNFIACSASVAENLSRRHGIDPARIEIVHEFIPSTVLDCGGLADAAKRVRAELGISDTAIVVGGAGTVTWRKGYDLFVLAALGALNAAPESDMHFVWLGGTAERHIPRQIEYDLRTLGLEHCVHFVSHRSNPLDYMATFDMLCMTSREDPYPLVMLECAALAKPIVCFDKSGGGPEFVGRGCGFVVPYLDIAAMSARVVELARNGALRRDLGRHGQSNVSDDHDVGVIAPKIAEIIERSIKSGARGR